MRPELVLNDHDIDEAMIFFGSARIPEPEVAQKQFKKQAKKNFDANPNDLKLKKNFSNKPKMNYPTAFILKKHINWHKLLLQHQTGLFITGGGPSFIACRE